MAFVTRITRLFRADLNAVMERLEEPDVLLRLAIEEMDEALSGDRRRLKATEHELTEIDSRLRNSAADIEALGGELDLCFAADNEELARTLIRRRLEIEHAVDRRRERQTSMEAFLDSLNKRLAENTLRFESMRQKLEMLEETTVEAESPKPFQGSRTTDFRICNADVDIAFLREKQKRSVA